MEEYLVFADWSGNPSFSSTTNYCVTSLLLPKSKLDKTRYRFRLLISSLARCYNLKLLGLKVTATDLIRGRNQFSHLSIQQRMEVITRIIDYLVDSDFEIMSVYFEKSDVVVPHYRRADAGQWVERWTWQLVLERISQYMELRRAKARVVIQSINDQANFYKAEFLSHLLNVSGTYILPDRISSIGFEEKEEICFLQLADVVAWIFHRYYMEYVETNMIDELAIQGFDALSPLLIRDQEGKIEGFGMKIFPSLEISEFYHSLLDPQS